jgi:hypothetical protein
MRKNQGRKGGRNASTKLKRLPVEQSTGYAVVITSAQLPPRLEPHHEACRGSASKVAHSLNSALKLGENSVPFSLCLFPAERLILYEAGVPCIGDDTTTTNITTATKIILILTLIMKLSRA